MVPLAVGTDGGGSIRIPSAFCGTYGLKPTFGLVPKLPGFAGWPTLSVTGPIAGSARDLELALSVMAGPSALDPLSYPAPARVSARRPLDGLRIAVSEDLGFAAVDAEVRAAFRVRGRRRCMPSRHTPSRSTRATLWDAIALPEGYASEGRLVEEHPELVGADAAAITLAGKRTSARATISKRSNAADEFTVRWLAFFDRFDVLLTPTMPTVAFEVGRLAPATIEGRAVPESFDAWCALALPANLAGLPAASVPIAASGFRSVCR